MASRGCLQGAGSQVSTDVSERSREGPLPPSPNRGTLSQQFWVAQSKNRQKQGTWRGQKREREQDIREKADACTEMRETGVSGEREREAE